MDDVGNGAGEEYLEVKFAELRAAIGRLDDDGIMRVIDHVREEAGRAAARHLVSELLRAAHNRITEPVNAECITMALARYDHDDKSH